MPRTLAANLDTDLSAKQAAPVNLLMIYFSSGTVYLSDATRTVGGQVYTGLVTDWGDINQAVAAQFGEEPSQIGSLRITVNNTRDDESGREAFSDHFFDDTPEATQVRFYQWNEDGAAGASDTLEIFRGYIHTGESGLEYDEEECSLEITNIVARYDRVIGEQINDTEYPDADPDDLGAWKNIVYGSNVKVKCPCVSTGALTTLTSDRTSSTSTIYVSDVTGFSAGTLVKCGGEIMLINSVGANYLSCGRGYSGTSAVAHQKGEYIWEYNRPCWYLVADHPVKSIDGVYVGGVLQTGSDFTAYEDYTGYMNDGVYHQNVACIKFNSYPALEQSIDIEISANATYDVTLAEERLETFKQTISALGSGIEWTHVSTGGQMVGKINFANNKYMKCLFWVYDISHTSPIIVLNNRKQISYSGVEEFAVRLTKGLILYAGNVQGPIYADVAGEPKILITSEDGYPLEYGYKQYYIPLPHNPQHRYFKSIYLDGTESDPLNPGVDTHMTVHPSISFYSYDAGEWVYYHSKYISFSVPYTRTDPSDVDELGWSDLNETQKLSFSSMQNIGRGRSGATQIDITLNTGAEISGNTVADVQIGTVSAQVDGYADDGSGTYTGTPSAIIQRPDHVRKHFLISRLGLSASYIDATSFAAAGALYASNGYNFSGVIPGEKTAVEVLRDMDEQSRSITRWDAGTIYLDFRKTWAEWGTPSSDSTITENHVAKSRIRAVRSSATSVVNKIELRYAPDPTKEGDAAYQSLAVASDSASIAKHGERRPAGAYDFYLVRSSTMAEDLAAKYVTLFKDIRTFYKLVVALDQLKLVGNDVVTLNLPRFDRLDGIWAKVIRANQYIGGHGKIDTIELEVEIWPHKSFRRTIAETITLSDLVTGHLPLAGTQSDGAIITAQVAAALVAAATGETITVPDEVTGIMVGNPAVDDAVSLADALTFDVDFYASRETTNLADSLGIVSGLGWGSMAWGSAKWGGQAADITDQRAEGPGLADAQTAEIGAALSEEPPIEDAIAVVFLGTGWGSKSWGANAWGA